MRRSQGAEGSRGRGIYLNPEALEPFAPVIPKKRFGQHFLKDQNIIRRIVDKAEISKDDIVLEIGPGLGDMTSLLSKGAGKVIAVELDRGLYSLLLNKFGVGSSEFGVNNIEIVNADALKFDIKGLFDRFGKKLKIVANLPYNISTPILFRLLETRDFISSMTLMFQKEVADRLIASPGTKDYGVLSVYAQLYTRPSMIFRIPPNAFTPPPKVYSAVVRLDILKEPSVEANDETLMLKVVKAAFGQRRKTIVNALSTGLKLQKGIISSALKMAGIDSLRRGETLTLSEFCNLSNELKTSIAN